MARNRPVTPEDVQRGERLAALRKTRWSSQEKMATALGLDRPRVVRIESGEDRFLSPELQEQLASAYGVSVGALVEYARDTLTLDELVASPPPTRTVEAEDRYPSRAPVLAAARARGIDPAAIDAVAAVRLHSDEDPGEGAWFAELERWRKLVRRFDTPAGEAFSDEELVTETPSPPKRKR